MAWVRWGLAVLLVSACFDPADSGYAGESYMQEDFPPWSCMDGGSSSSGPCESSTGDGTLACLASSDCPGDQVCAASFDGDIGAFRCGSTCVSDLDEASWCSDASACCAAGASCVRGLCTSELVDTSGAQSSGDSSSEAGSSSSSAGTESTT
jgi:hypothetical protein